MGKHAYLIMAHKNDFTFHTLLKLLDDSRNTLFVHMDDKVRNYDPAEIEKMVTRATLIHEKDRKNVRWGGYSLIAAELTLLNTATEFGYFDYYHLISGEDLPIKTQDYIHNFFDEKNGKEFVHFSSPDFAFLYRVKYYYIFQEFLNKDSRIRIRLDEWSRYLQEFLHIHRNRNITFRMGSNWFSITDELARYIISKKKWIRKTFKHTLCCDEVFLQTLVINSEFKNKLYIPTDISCEESNQRHIDWGRGDGCSPWIFRIDDAEELKNSPMLFSRKFNCKVDKRIIECIVDYLEMKEL